MEHAELSWCGPLGNLVCEGKSDAYGTDERGRRVDEAHNALFNKLRAMDHERTALQRDAERYRWLRDKGDSTWTSLCARSGFDAETVDAILDGAIEASGG